MIGKNRNYSIDIFVICYERTPILERCLESIRKYTNIEHRVIVVEGKRSAAKNRNIALSEVTSPWFVMMDDDVVVTPKWLEIMMVYAHDKVGQIQPKILQPNGRIFSAEKIFTTPWGENTVIGMGEKDKGQYDYIRIAELLSGTCCLYNAEILNNCSFDTKYRGAQWEDCDFSMQIRKEGFYLLYCGKAAVYHYNLYRNPANENFTYFKEKWFGKRRLCQRGVLYVGLACDLNCVFCYYRHVKKKTFRPLDELKRECETYRRFYGNTHVDISGGEPTIHPKIVELVKFCKAIDLKPTIITHGQRLSKDFVEKLKRAGIEDFLISYHGPEKEHEFLTQRRGGYNALQQGIKNLNDADVPFRINTVVTKHNYSKLPALARELLVINPQVVNLIMFNPFEEWITHPKAEFQIRYSEVAPFIMETIPILESKCIEVNVRYMPFCLLPSFEDHIMNFPQMPYDQWEWDFKHGHRLRSEFDYLYYAMIESRRRYDHGPPCKHCALKLICSGLPKQYARVFGWDELRPWAGIIIRDPCYFKTLKREVKRDELIENTLLAYICHDLAAAYPMLIDSDPLIFHQVTPLENVRPLQGRKMVRIEGIARKSLEIAEPIGGEWLKRKIPPHVKNRVRGIFGRLISCM